ncbi:MAG: tRNA (adenosine(37)-N6)-threonylcarbamoyltransferase complex transferase subunit TsaD [Desulfovibrionaceae bacterium]|jgi:N6-L-threonylcarbamoyladenine synthase|nr:tRNA (adenosine(37)-N6)-threonylcarbamoyltransferase complex transferase subunit TsaD [Desulfovibrionaceae bacterium]
MLCLGIETSCDETALALVRDGRVLGQALSSQADAHALFGGVVPEIASREHYRLLAPLYRDLLARTAVRPEEIDVVAVARGPGLLGSLLVGLGFAKGLALGLSARLVGVNHLHAHLLAASIDPEARAEIVFPALGVLVSGGHTHIYHMRSDTDFELLGRTLDDAAGEAFDKVAKMLGLPYPGGAHIDRLGALAEPDPDLFPRPYLDNQNLDFSFSGLKTAVGVFLDSRPDLRVPPILPGGPGQGGVNVEELARLLPELPRVCASFTHAVADTLRVKTCRALDRVAPVRSLVVAGGVAANSKVRLTMRAVAEKYGLPVLLPSRELCTDNGIMIAYAGERLARAGRFHGPDLEAIPRGRPVPCDYLDGAGPADS